jgi:6,7-dimethyl-8-ribityllumazine synthase
MEPLMRQKHDTKPLMSARGLRVAIVAADYHAAIHERLLAGARGAFTQAGGVDTDLRVFTVDGVYDLPPVVLEALEAGFDAVVVTGCVVRGETRHDRHIVDAAFGQFSALAVRFRRPVALAVLTVEDLKQARARAGGDKGDAGAFAMRAALRTLDTMRLVREEAKR